MVRNRQLLVITSLMFFCVLLVSIVTAERKYRLEHEWAKIWINQDGTIDLFYNISITLESGDDINYVFVGQPKPDFTVGQARDQYNHSLVTSTNSEGVQVNLAAPLRPGHSIWFTLTTNVAHMIYNDTMNPGNVGMQFIPTWWEEARVMDLHILIVLPSNVTEEMVRTLTGADWNNTLYEDGRLAIYWEGQNLSLDERFPVGVSFPQEYVEIDEGESSGLVAVIQRYAPFLLIFGLFACLMTAVIYGTRRKSYQTPRIGMETLGIRRGLTAVESSYLLDLQPTRIVTEILYSLLKKRAIWVQSATPSLKLRIMPPFQGISGTSKTPLRYYEIDFLKAIKEEGALDEETLGDTLLYLQDTVEQKMRGYCRRDTIDYYRDIVAKAWNQVRQAGTSELASKVYDEELLWLFLDPDHQSRTEGVFMDKSFEPSPFWFWYWYSYLHYHPSPEYEPNVQTPSKSAKPPKIPGSEFADNIATAVEKTSNNIVADLEKFTNAVLPMSTTKASTEPAREGASCVCACAACACACACVSCACACASGGVG